MKNLKRRNHLKKKELGKSGGKYQVREPVRLYIAVSEINYPEGRKEGLGGYFLRLLYWCSTVSMVFIVPA
jgi:hypothetical protein